MSTRSTKLRAVLAALTTSLVVLSLVVVARTDQGPSVVERIDLVRQCMSDELEPGTFLYQSTGGMNGDVYGARLACARIAVGDPSDVDEVATILDSIFSISRLNDNARFICHDLAHEFGRWSYEALGDGALLAGYDDCGFGYYHGVMQSTVESGELLDRLKLLHDFCVEQSVDERGDLDVPFYSFCGHGVGHAAGTRTDDLDVGVQACQVMDLPFETLRYLDDGVADPLSVPGELECFSGFLNEVMKTRDIANKSMNTPVESVAECEDVAQPYRSRCISYSLFYSPIPMSEIRAFCPTIPESDLRGGCWESVGFRGSLFLVEPLTEPESQDLRAGLTLDTIADRKPETAAFIGRLCDGDTSISCLVRFTLDVLQRLQRNSVIRDVCAQIENRRWVMECYRTVDAVGDMHND